MPNITADMLEAWGKQAAADFLKNPSRSLNDLVEKVASENKLNHEQIQRVCEFSNIHTYEEMMKTASDRRAEFPVADFRHVIGRLTTAAPAEKTASFNFSSLKGSEQVDWEKVFLGDDLRVKLASEELSSRVAKPVTLDKAAEGLIKLSAIQSEIEQHVHEAAGKKETMKQAMKSIVKDLLADGHTFGDLYKAAVASSPSNQKVISEIFSEIAPDLGVGSVKAASLAVTSPDMCRVWMIQKLAFLKGDTNKEIKMLQAKHQLEMAVGNYVDAEKDRYQADWTRAHFDEVMTRVRRKLKDVTAKKVIDDGGVRQETR